MKATTKVNPLLTSLPCAWVQVPSLASARRVVVDALGGPDDKVVRLCVTEGIARSGSAQLPRGLDSVEVVVADVDLVAARIDELPDRTRVGYTLMADLAEFGGNQHRSALWRMPWGTHLIVMAGLTKPVGREFARTDRQAGRVFKVQGHPTQRLQETTTGGTCGSSFFVADLHAVYQSLQRNGYHPTEISTRTSVPHSGRLGCTVLCIEGEWLEFICAEEGES